MLRIKLGNKSVGTVDTDMSISTHDFDLQTLWNGWRRTGIETLVPTPSRKNVIADGVAFVKPSKGTIGVAIRALEEEGYEAELV
jgi:hypothetical protein